ncbi:MAG TPA: SgcJ/EcaC family oxidoreductase [Acidimicrobiales bacterium]|nr:SgcJ/EcaC family oxidoreductase [Acidimicrobiales bacterium]
MTQDLDGAKTFLAEFGELWGKNDGQLLADQFTADGTLINPFGERADGREALAAMYSSYFGGMLSGTSTTVRVESVRQVGEDSAFIDAEQTITGPDGSVVLTVHLAALLRIEGGDWRFVDSRPYAYVGDPR